MDDKSIVLLAAENAALPGGKVGGIGDVIRDLPLALADRGWQPTVLTPGYGVFTGLPRAVRSGNLVFQFAGARTRAELWQVQGPDPRVRHLFIEHPLLVPHGSGHIYYDDGPHAPFASDAGKFAFYSAAAAAFVIGCQPGPKVVHLHDWHTAMYLVLREFDPAFRALKKITTVYTIHNLALQGTRPLKWDISSLESWFPKLYYPHNRVADPRYADCVNPMATAIRLADKLNTVSPTYAKEILLPDNPERGFDGGEGLERELQAAAVDGRLVGILNGCFYPKRRVRKPAWRSFLKAAVAALTDWMTQRTSIASSHYFASQRLALLPRRRPRTLLTSVGRLTGQKVDLFLTDTGSGRSALEVILSHLGSHGMLILLGSGDPEVEIRLTRIAATHENFLFLSGYSQALAEYLYEAGDLFLMPSSFEPCGISQMLAMRAGQPCVVHAVGGLVDTVRDGVTGFVFAGARPHSQAANFASAVEDALEMKNSGDGRWRTMCCKAAAERFSWDAAAAIYEREVYALED